MQVYFWLIEQTVPQARTNQRTNENVHKTSVEFELCAFAFDNVFHQIIAQYKAGCKQQSVPAGRYKAEVEYLR